MLLITSLFSKFHFSRFPISVSSRLPRISFHLGCSSLFNPSASFPYLPIPKFPILNGQKPCFITSYFSGLAFFPVGMLISTRDLINSAVN